MIFEARPRVLCLFFLAYFAYFAVNLTLVFQRPYRRANPHKHWPNLTSPAVPNASAGTAQKSTKPLQTLAWHGGTAKTPPGRGGEKLKSRARSSPQSNLKRRPVKAGQTWDTSGRVQMSKSSALFDLTGSHTSSQVDLTGKTSKKINVYGGPHRFTGKKEIYGMYHISAGCDWRRAAHSCPAMYFCAARPSLPIRTEPH